MIYKNPYYKKIRGSYIMTVSCGECKTDVAEYQKVGKGGLVRMHIDRITKTSIDLWKVDKVLKCSNCSEILGIKTILKRENKKVYKMIRSKFNTRIK